MCESSPTEASPAHWKPYTWSGCLCNGAGTVHCPLPLCCPPGCLDTEALHFHTTLYLASQQRLAVNPLTVHTNMLTRQYTSTLPVCEYSGLTLLMSYPPPLRHESSSDRSSAQWISVINTKYGMCISITWTPTPNTQAREMPTQYVHTQCVDV